MYCPNCEIPLTLEPAQHGGLEEPSWDAYYECERCGYQPDESAAEIDADEAADYHRDQLK